MSYMALETYCDDNEIDLHLLIGLLKGAGYTVIPPVDYSKAFPFLTIRHDDRAALEQIWPPTKGGTATRIGNAIQNLGLTFVWELAERGVDTVKLPNFGRKTKDAFNWELETRGLVRGTPHFDALIQRAKETTAQKK